MERIVNEVLNEPFAPKESVESSIVNFYPNSIRIIEYPNGEITYERKTPIEEVEVKSKLYKYVISKEQIYSVQEISKILDTNIDGTFKGRTGTTYRMRRMFQGWKVDNILVDLFITSRFELYYGESGQVTRSNTISSVEVETKDKISESEREKIVKKLYNYAYGWDIKDIPKIYFDVKEILKKFGIKGTEDLQTPIDISWNDLTAENMIMKKHGISFKADGYRTLLLYSPQGIFLVTSLLGIFPLELPPSFGKFRIDKISILDGEIIGNNYWSFDILVDENEKVSNLSLNKRYERLQKYRGRDVPTQMRLPLVPEDGVKLTPGKIRVYVKPIYFPENPTEFFGDVESAISYPQKQRVGSDGIIFTPVDKPYFTKVLKWKPIDRLTVDFFIKSDMGKLKLGTWNRTDFLFHDEIVPVGINPSMAGQIAEFQYLGNNKWQYIRTRFDKARPNSEMVYNSILRLYSDPISEEAITGKSFSLMRKYHNRVKRQIYDLLEKSGVKTITDIGSAKGGDLSSWKRGKFFVNAVEPDPENVKEILQRIQNIDPTVDIDRDKFNSIPLYSIQGDDYAVDLFEAKAEEYLELVTPNVDQTDALTLFNSATFIGTNTLSDLVVDIPKDNGYVVIMVMDGKVLQKEYLQSGFTDNELISIRKAPVETQRKIGTELRGIGVGEDTFGDLGNIYIQLKDSATVSEPQREGLVDVDVLIDTMREQDWIPEIDTYLTQETLLGPEESRYTSAQRLLIFRKAYIDRYQDRVIVRKIYNPLPPSQIEEIESPWGDVIRIGVAGDTNEKSFNHALLQATNAKYRKESNVTKEIMALSDVVKTQKGSSSAPIYIIIQDTWDMYTRLNNNPVYFSAFVGMKYGNNRKPGIVLIENNDHWEPLAKKTMDNKITYIW